MYEQEDKNKLVWIADEFKAHQRDVGWYAGLFLFGAILIAWGLYTQNVITTILFVIMVFVIYILSHHEPSKVMVGISDRGITINHVFYPYANLKFFWIQNREHGQVLTVETKSFLNRHLSIELEDENPNEVRLLLMPHIEEVKDYEENFIDFLIRNLKI